MDFELPGLEWVLLNIIQTLRERRPSWVFCSCLYFVFQFGPIELGYSQQLLKRLQIFVRLRFCCELLEFHEALTKCVWSDNGLELSGIVRSLIKLCWKIFWGTYSWKLSWKYHPFQNITSLLTWIWGIVEDRVRSEVLKGRRKRKEFWSTYSLRSRWKGIFHKPQVAFKFISGFVSDMSRV